MLGPTTLLGAAFPSAVQLCARDARRVGRDVGRVYAWSTTGTIAGALLAGFALVPFLGVQVSMTLAAALNVGVGATVVAMSGVGHTWRSVALIPLVLFFTVGVAFVPRWDPRVMTAGVSVYAKKFSGEPDPVLRFRQDAASRELLFYREGWNSTVVERTARMTSLTVDGKGRRQQRPLRSRRSPSRVNNPGNAYFEIGRLLEAAQTYRQVAEAPPPMADERARPAGPAWRVWSTGRPSRMPL
jgi:hypothetical protein